MTRAPFVITATVAGTAAVLGFHAHEPARSSASRGAATAAGGGKSADGDVISTRYGNAQVRVTVKGGRITEIQALQLQGNDPKSVAISSSAEPLLRASALQKQSADIDVVSGATYTSESYRQSLQSALDRLGFHG